jgi:hypothetical protein
VNALSIKYCDLCKWNELQGSYDHKDKEGKELIYCPYCGCDLDEADSFEQIP